MSVLRPDHQTFWFQKGKLGLGKIGLGFLESDWPTSSFEMPHLIHMFYSKNMQKFWTNNEEIHAESIIKTLDLSVLNTNR